MNRIGTRFCLVVGAFALVFSTMILYRAWASARRHADEMTAVQAEIALVFDLAIREYIKESVRPEMEKRIGPEDFVLEAMSTSYAARQIVTKVQERFPDYLLRFPSENPRNLVNRANTQEQALLTFFSENPDVDEWSGRLKIDGVDYFARTSAMRLEEVCLRCHGDPDNAPRALLDRYGATGGFGYKVGDLAGMDMVAIPMERVHAELASQAKGNLLVMSVWLAALVASILGAFGWIVTRRLAAITRHFQKAACQETMALQPAPETGRDEITVLARGFNRLSDRLRRLQESLEEQVRQRTNELSVTNEQLLREQRLLKQSLKMHDRERQVIAYEIHDGLAQQLVGAEMTFQLAAQALSGSPEQGKADYETGMAMLARCIGEARRLINGVRPPLLDEEGIAAAVKHLLAEDANGGGPELEFRHPAKLDRLEPMLENAVYRIVQEAVTNARKHSGSDRIRVTIAMQDDHLRVEVQDWGCGFDVKQQKGKAMGLRGIKKRTKLLGGKAKIESELGRGTHVIVDLPLVPPDDDSDDSDY